MSDIIKSLTSRSIPFKTEMSATLVSSYRGGGSVAIIAYPESVEELSDCIRFANIEGLQYIPLGNGSNILIRDGGYDGIMISLVGFRDIQVRDTRIVCGSGAGLANVIKVAEAHELSGLEELSGIPGTIGGASFMNAGAFGREISELIENVTIYDTQYKKVRCVSRDELQFSYRSSGSSFENAIMLEATISLAKGENIKERAASYRERRRALQPSAPSLGSVFRKTSDGVGAGYYIEKAGLKGTRIGGAAISEKHANFIINKGGGTAKDYTRLAELAKSVVEKKFDIKLEPEVITIGKE